MKSRRSFTSGALALATAALLAGCGSGSDGSSHFGMTPKPVSHVFTQSNATLNQVINFRRHRDGTLEEVERVNTGGAGLGEGTGPDALSSAGSVQISPDHKLLFTVNAGDKTVSAFNIAQDGRLTLVSRIASGTAAAPKSVSYDPKSQTLFVLHGTGPNHISALSVGVDGKLTDTGARYSVNSATASNRVPTHIIVSPDSKFVLVDVLFDAPPQAGPNGPALTPSNTSKKDGLFVFPLKENGQLGTPVPNDAGGPTPFSLAFLNGSNNQFVNTLAAANGAVLSTLAADGTVTSTKIANVSLARAPNGPSETCWVTISPDNKWTYVTNFGLGNVSALALGNNSIELKNGEAAYESGNGKFSALAGIPSSGPSDSWASADGYQYQLYGNASAIVVYKMDGANLQPVGRVPVPLNSTSGLTGF